MEEEGGAACRTEEQCRTGAHAVSLGLPLVKQL